MRFAREHLIFKALAALHELAHNADAPINPTMAIRFALAFLFAHSNGERRAYDDFWRDMQDAHTNAFHEDVGQYLRGTALRTDLNGIAASLGLFLDAELEQLLSDMRAGKAERDRRTADRDRIAQARAEIIERSRAHTRALERGES